jgi:hypothetical protein
MKMPAFLATPSSNGAGTNPRKVSKDTSYKASGLVPPTPALDQELGSSQPSIIREVVPELISPYQRSLVYAKMMNDASVDVSVRVAKTPVLGAEFFMEPYSSDPNDVFISEFIWDNLMEGMSSPFVNSIDDVLHFYEDGYSVEEMVFENRVWSPKAKGGNSRMYTMLKKLAYRPANTIKEIQYDDNGGPLGVTQVAIKADGSVQDVDIPIDKAIIFTMNRKGGDLQGKSILRTAYPHWYYKTHFYKIDAIQKERHSLGVPKGKLLPGYNNKDKLILRQLLKNLRTNEESFMALTPNVDVEFAQIHGNLVNVMESAVHHHMMILMNVLAQFLVMGTETGSGGGRATAGAQSDVFMKALKHVANYIADSLNMYLIPQLVVWNFPTTNFPKLKVRNIGETRDLQMLGSAIANLLSQGGFTMDDPTEAWIRRTFDMPTQDPTTAREPASAPTTVATPDGPQPAKPVKPQKGSTKQPRDKVGSNVPKPPNAPS